MVAHVIADKGWLVNHVLIVSIANDVLQLRVDKVLNIKIGIFHVFVLRHHYYRFHRLTPGGLASYYVI